MGSKGGGGSQSQTVTQKADPWVGVQPYLANLYGNAAQYFSGPAPSYYPGNLSAPVSWDTQYGMSQIRNAATGPDVTGAKTNNLLNNFLDYTNLAANPFASGQRLNEDKFAQGAFVGSNPYLRSMVNAASQPLVNNFQQAIAPSLASQFSAAGRMGSGAHVAAVTNAEQTLGQQLGNLSTNMFGQAYESDMGRMFQAQQMERNLQSQAQQYERGYQLQAAGLTPAMEQLRYLPGQQMMGIGDATQQLQQDAINREIQRYQYNQDTPMQRLQAYSAILSGAAPYASSTSNQSGSQTQPYNRLTGTIGGGLGGYALGGLFSMGPMGAALGALAGLFG